jgi:hypothetical protein
MAKGVIASLHNTEADRCVDIVRRPDGTFGFQEFRRDAEDGGGWTLVSDHPHLSFAREEEAVASARATVVWLREPSPSAEAQRAAKPSVASTIHNEHADRAVKILKRAGGGFGFQEFRRDPEDAGRWTLVSDAPQAAYASEEQAAAAARASIPWFREQTTSKSPR